MGKKHYSDAIDCYTRAINQKVLSDSENSILFANRAHVNLLLGNYRRALADAEDAIKLCPTNVKVISWIISDRLWFYQEWKISTFFLFLLFLVVKRFRVLTGILSSCQSIFVIEFVE